VIVPSVPTQVVGFTGTTVAITGEGLTFTVTGKLAAETQPETVQVAV
jgi:hypothetical protein